MPERVEVYYNGWGEHWHWGSLVSTTAITGRPLIAFEYSDHALRRGLELSAFKLPLRGPRFHRDFPSHQMGLPGPVYDSLPDGWGLLLMDRLFKQRGLAVARVGPLDRLTYLGANAMGALSYVPVASDMEASAQTIPLSQLAAEVKEVLQGEGASFLQRLLQMGGSPHGARPKAMLYLDPSTGRFSTVETPGAQAWMVKFPAQHEAPEVCAIEAVYAQCLRDCGIPTPDTAFFPLPHGQSAFASRRFDRNGGVCVPMQSLAAFTGADFRTPGALDYKTFLRATHFCTNDVREKAAAFERAVFNVAFHNRDDHPKNFAYLMSASGQWTLAPAYDVTFNEGPGGYHQMDVMGEALNIERQHLLRLAEQEAELSPAAAKAIIDRVCEAANGFSASARHLLPGQISKGTLSYIQGRIDSNVERLR